MKTKIATLSMLGAVVLVTAGSYESCFGEPCPDLYIACPALECPQGFKVDKSGCAICECVGDTTPVTECFSDTDCQAGEFCDFGVVPMTDGLYAPCYDDGTGADYCGWPQQAGECKPIEVKPCAGLDEWTCIETAGCEPVYEGSCDRCAVEGGCGDVACEVWFIECREAPIDPCSGAWIDQNCQCRAPNDGSYPAECCGLATCYSDADCGAGFVCQLVEPMTGERYAAGGICVPATTTCFSDFDCQPGFFCALPMVDCAGPVDTNGDGVIDQNDEQVDCMAAGICTPIEEPPVNCFGDADCAAGFFCAFDVTTDPAAPINCEPDANGNCLVAPLGVCMPIEPVDPCLNLDEQTCAATTGCQAVYGPCNVCDCLETDPDCVCAVEGCGQFVGCQAIPLPVVCFSDVECGAGMLCSFDLTNCGGAEPVDGGAAAPVNCGGVCVRA